MTISLWWSSWWRMEQMWMSVIMRAGPPSMPPPLVDLQRLQGEGSIEAWNQLKKKPH